MPLIKLIAASQHLDMGRRIGVVVKDALLPQFVSEGIGGGNLSVDFKELVGYGGADYRYYVRKHIAGLVRRMGNASMKAYMTELLSEDNQGGHKFSKANDADTIEFFKGLIQTIS